MTVIQDWTKICLMLIVVYEQVINEKLPIYIALVQQCEKFARRIIFFSVYILGRGFPEWLHSSSVISEGNQTF